MRQRIREDESFLEARVRRRKGSRGKSAEAVVEDVLKRMKEENPHFDFDRLPDTRAAGRIMPARVSDFLLFFANEGQAISIALEVKSLEKGCRLNIKSKFPQLPRMRRRELAGCGGYLLAQVKPLSKWFMLPIAEVPSDVKSILFDPERHRHSDDVETLIKEVLVHELFRSR
jgi:hypothetical protein